nr:UDP-galactopyranose mutase [Caballeronia sp. INML2]
MTQTIIGVFDTFQDAEFAQTRLEADGIARTDMRVHSNDERSTLSTDSTVDGAAAGRPAGEFHEGAMARIEHFFKNLFGDSDRPAEVGHYQEAVRRGGALLSVDVANEAETDRVRDVRHDVLYKHVIYSGPIDEYFDFCFGPLPYRSLRFVHETLTSRIFNRWRSSTIPTRPSSTHALRSTSTLPDRVRCKTNDLVYVCGFLMVTVRQPLAYRAPTRLDMHVPVVQ